MSCQLCEFVCPPKAIRITPGSVPEDQEDREHVEKAPQEFEINMLRCIYCGYCQEVSGGSHLSTGSILLFGYSREELINNKTKLYELGGTLPDRHYKWDKKKQRSWRVMHTDFSNSGEVEMNAVDFLFWVFAVITVGGGICMIFSDTPFLQRCL